MLKKEKIKGSVKQIVHIYSIVIDILHVISKPSVTCMYRAVQRYIHSSITYVYSIVLRYVNRERKGEKGRDCNRLLHNILQNQFLQLHATDIQCNTKALNQSTNNRAFQVICHITKIMLNRISRGYWSVVVFTQSFFRYAVITWIQSVLSIGQLLLYYIRIIRDIQQQHMYSGVLVRDKMYVSKYQSYLTDLKIKGVGDHHLPLHQNFLPKTFFRISFIYMCTLYTDFNFNILLVYTSTYSDFKNFYKKLFGKTNFGMMSLLLLF